MKQIKSYCNIECVNKIKKNYLHYAKLFTLMLEIKQRQQFRYSLRKNPVYRLVLALQCEKWLRELTSIVVIYNSLPNGRGVTRGGWRWGRGI